MAEITPFKGILYNTEKITDLAHVVTPPYDVISPQERDRYYASHPNNMIRLILGKSEKTDTSNDNPHTRAAEYFSQWMEKKILKRDDAPALYLKSIDFEWNNTKYTRYGLISLVRIEPFEKGVILPHEKTFSRVKSERFELMKACNTNFDPVFALFPDNRNVLATLKEEIQNQTPVLNFKDHFGRQHRLWRLTAPDLQESIAQKIAPESLFIADGHHRYETALNYRNWIKARDPKIDNDHPANFVMMYLSSMKDPGLIVLPTHRLLKNVDEKKIAAILQKSKDFFDITSFSFETADRKEIQAKFLSSLNARNTQNSIGLFHKDHTAFHLLTLKSGVMDELFSDTLDPTLKKLDVTVLTRLIFMELLGFDQNNLDDEKQIGYNSLENNAIEAVISKEYDAAFILNPTKIEQVRKVALNRLTMPRKSTYFYPKVTAGIVQNLLT